MGVAEWRLKINQPSLFQFVRKQKRKEIIKKKKKEKEGGRKQKGNPDPKMQSHPDPKMQSKIGKAKRTGTPWNTKRKGNFTVVGFFCFVFFNFLCFFKISSVLPDMPGPQSLTACQQRVRAPILFSGHFSRKEVRGRGRA